jgi:hypothetical protein
MHPYRQKLEDSLMRDKELLSLLQEKAKLIEISIYNLDNIHNIENNLKLDLFNFKIELIETKNRIESLKNTLKIKQEYFDRFTAQIENDIIEVEKHYNEYLIKVIELAKKDSRISLFVSKNDFKKIEQSLELKIKIFKDLKQILKEKGIVSN